MRIATVLVLVTMAACAAKAPGAPTTPTPAAATTPPPIIVEACASPEHRQFDFWLGDWELVVRSRATPGGPFAEARGRQHIEAILGGCAVAESFSADGPGTPWAGRSVSSWQPALGQWRQTWVDDSGGYLAFTGGVVDGVMTLVGEPRTNGAKHIVMRMVFLDVTADALRWEWQRQVDGGAWEPQMVIAYRRASPR